MAQRVRVTVLETAGDTAAQQYAYAFAQLLFFTHADSDDQLRMIGLWDGVGVADDRAPQQTQRATIDAGTQNTRCWSHWRL